MATKTQIATLIDDNLASGTDITALELRDVFKDNTNNLLDEVYGTPVQDTEATTNILTINPALSDVTYTIYFLKQGRKVHVEGTIRNNGLSYLSAINIGTLNINTISGYTFNAVGTLSDNSVCRLRHQNVNELNLEGVIPPSDRLIFNYTFYTND